MFNNGRMENPEVEKIKVWGSEVDIDIFKDVLCILSSAELEDKYPSYSINSRGRKKKVEQPKHVAAYFYFYNNLIEFIEDESLVEKQRKLDLFPDVFRRGLELVLLELEDGDDPQVIFESINARGAPLLPSDLIKNFLFRIARDQSKSKNQDLDVKRLYDAFWRNFDHYKSDNEEEKNKGKIFWNVEEGVGKNFRSRLDMFLQHFLTLKLKREINAHRIFHEFQEFYYSHNDLDVEEMLEEVKHFSEIYSRFLLPMKQTPLGNLLYKIKTMENSTVYPILLYLCNQYDDQVVVEILKPLESYYFRRMITQKGTKSYNKISLALLDGVMSNKNDEVTFIIKFLMEKKGDNEMWPNDKELKEYWMDEKTYKILQNQEYVLFWSPLRMQ
jgi:hypothetical protein